jgi:hypothetical protein
VQEMGPEESGRLYGEHQENAGVPRSAIAKGVFVENFEIEGHSS